MGRRVAKGKKIAKEKESGQGEGVAKRKESAQGEGE